MRQAKIFCINPVAVKHCVKMLTRVALLHRKHQVRRSSNFIDQVALITILLNDYRQKLSMLMLMTLLALLPTHRLIH